MRDLDLKAFAKTSSAGAGPTKDDTGAASSMYGKRLKQALRQPKVLCALLPVQRCHRALFAGKAPKCLQRKLIRPTDRLRKLDLICNWVEKPSHAPHLTAGPLVGYCLADLVKPQQHTANTASPNPSSASSAIRFPESIRQRAATHPVRQNERQYPPKPWAFSQPDHIVDFGSPLGTRQLPGPYALAPRVQNELLQRCSGLFSNALVKPMTSGSSRRVIAPMWVKPTQTTMRQTQSFHSGNARLQYVTQLADRFAQSLRSLMNSAFTAKRIALNNPEVWALASLAVPPTGPGAMRDTLLYWAGLAGPVGSSPGNNTVSQASERSAVPVVASKAATLPGDAVQYAREGFYPQVGSLPLPEAGLDGGRPLVAPALRTDVPATLLPPRVPFEGPTPFSSAALRHEALRDETDLVQEDMDLLADKIKRILDEDARRHGIQV